MRLIDADALPVHKAYCVDEAGWGANFYVVDKSDIDAAPTIDAEPVKHGRWIYKPYENDEAVWLYHCSECNAVSALAWNYCRECGAKMDLEVTNGRD